LLGQSLCQSINPAPHVAFTMDVYSHIIKGRQSDAMALRD
jgi:hypothetical protein